MAIYLKDAQEVVDRLIASCWNFRTPESPQQKKMLVEMWQQGLSGYNYPPFVYQEAVSSWLASAKNNPAPPYPGDILEHCRRVIERIESDPKRRPGLEKWREDYKLKRVAELTGES